MYSIGQKFDVVYPPEAAQWCNDNSARIVNISGIYEIVSLPTPTDDEFMSTLRAKREIRLTNTDKYLLADYPISPESLEAIKTYRQLLRDLPAQPGAPWDGGGELTPWPELPSVE